MAFFVVGLFSSLCFPKLSFRFYGGMTHVMSSDISSAAKAANEILDLYDPTHTGYFEKLCCGSDFSGELIFSISKNVGVGLGIELIRLRNESHLTYDPIVPIVQTTTYKINTLPIMFNLYYSFPITQLLNIYVSAGAGYYFLNMDYKSDSLTDYGILGVEDQTYTFQSKQGSLGIQARWGIEVIVSRTISFLVGGMGRYVKYSNIKGDWTNTGIIPTGVNVNESGSNHYFWHYKISIMGKNYPIIDFRENAPADAANIRKGVINLSGLSFTAGIKIGLDSKKK